MPRVEAVGDPEYWEKMGPTDREKYLVLRSRFLKPGHRNQRNHSLNKFKEALSEVSAFVHEPGANTIDRALVTGFYQMSDSFAINVQQFSHIYPKCKSSVNLALKSLGYSIHPSKSDTALEFIQLFPSLKDNFSFTRQWVIRSIGDEALSSSLPEPEKKINLDFGAIIPHDLLSLDKIEQPLLDDYSPPEFIPQDIYSMSSIFSTNDNLGDLDFYGF